MKVVGAVFALEVVFVAIYSTWPNSKPEAIFAIALAALVGGGVFL